MSEINFALWKSSDILKTSGIVKTKQFAQWESPEKSILMTVINDELRKQLWSE